MNYNDYYVLKCPFCESEGKLFLPDEQVVCSNDNCFLSNHLVKLIVWNRVSTKISNLQSLVDYYGRDEEHRKVNGEQ